MADYLTRICDFVVDTNFKDLPPAVVDQARRVVADTVAVVAAGARQKEVVHLSRRLGRAGAPSSTLLGQKRKTDPLNAALINGIAGTFLELDEGNQFARGHAAIHVIPAALAFGEERRISGKQFLTALVLGYEIACRIGIASKLRMTMHPHGSWGTVGGAVAVGKLARLNANDMRTLINIASSLTVASSRKTMLEGGTVRNVYAGVAGYMAVLSYHLLKSSFTGEADGIRSVWGGVVSDSFSPEIMVEELGSRWEISRNYFKQYACCRYNHSSLDALYAIIKKQEGGRLDQDRVKDIRIETYSLAAQLNSQQPDNMLAAKFSIPFAVATTIIHGDSGVASFLPDQVNRADIHQLAARVRVEENSEFTRMMPSRRPSRVSISLKDGRVFTETAFFSKGDIEDPYPVAELEAKFLDLAAPIYGMGKARQALDRTLDLEKLKDIRDYTKGL